MSEFTELLAERVQNPEYVKKFMEEVRANHKTSISPKELERIKAANQAVSEYLKEHPEHYRYY